MQMFLVPLCPMMRQLRTKHCASYGGSAMHPVQVSMIMQPNDFDASMYAGLQKEKGGKKKKKKGCRPTPQQRSFHCGKYDSLAAIPETPPVTGIPRKSW
jgi:hypothetical protein